MLSRIYRSEAEIRKQQINTLKIFNDNVVEVTENQDYQITFKLGPNEFCLQINLSQDFPKEKPILKISPVVSHPWVNSDGEIISAPGLLNFTLHSELGRVVQAIIREFERNPPSLLSDCPSNIMSPIREVDRLSPVYSIANNNSHRLVFPELSKLSLEELEFLNNNTDRQEEFLSELPIIKEQNRILDEFIDRIEELAEQNLSKEEELKKIRQEIDEKIEQVTKLAFENERLHVEYQNLSDKYSPINIKDKLRQAAEEAEKESEKIADKFLKGQIDVDKFVSLYTNTRSLCQNRKTKEEKLSQQLYNLKKAGF